jgi:hypothetical protein
MAMSKSRAKAHQRDAEAAAEVDAIDPVTRNFRYRNLSYRPAPGSASAVFREAYDHHADRLAGLVGGPKNGG